MELRKYHDGNSQTLSCRAVGPRVAVFLVGGEGGVRVKEYGHPRTLAGGVTY
jgi:hypothetical protein